MTKRIISILLAAVLTASFMCACSTDAEEGYPKPTERFFVNDFADIIEEADKKRSKNGAFDNRIFLEKVIIK